MEHIALEILCKEKITSTTNDEKRFFTQFWQKSYQLLLCSRLIEGLTGMVYAKSIIVQ
jgi:hypothetical protein